jgi:hypothetical protein
VNFHSKCDDKPNTLIIIKSINGNIFGGYTEQSWSGKGYRFDPNSFIFSLNNLKKKTIKNQLISNICCNLRFWRFNLQRSRNSR